MIYPSFLRVAVISMAMLLAVLATGERAFAAPAPLGGGGEKPLTIAIRPGQTAPRIIVASNKSRLVQFDRSFRQVVVGSKDIAEVVSLSNKSIYVLGKKRGTTNLTITDASGTVLAVVDVVVTYDIADLQHQLAELVPDDRIRITPAADALVLSGKVSSADSLRKIVAIAGRYAPGAVTNLLQIGGSQQVMLEVKFSEVERSAIQQLGLNILNGVAINEGTLSAALPPVSTSAFGSFGGLFTSADHFALRARIDALESRDLMRTLAEPNLVAMSGQTASFLAGGEYPIPVVQSTSGTVPTTTIEYKNFGVGLSFTPTVVSADVVNLNIKSEVSSLDDSASVEASGISVPGLRVRRAATTVELRDGETFAIAGLIQDDFQNTVNAIPGLANIPIIGALFRSLDFQHNQSELVVFITARLVQPTSREEIAQPTDKVEPPSMLHTFLFGNPEGTPPANDNQNDGQGDEMTARQPLMKPRGQLKSEGGTW